MIYLTFVLPALIFMRLMGRQSLKVWERYESAHPELYSRLNVQDNRPKTTIDWIVAQFVRIPIGTYVNLKTGQREHIFLLTKDIELAQSTNDAELIRLCKIRQRYWQAAVASAGFIPLMVVIYWGALLL
ncbi:MAG: hypothetical protein OIF51_16015 [Cellvibrionaceae bacterium]|nr:hypothetical protein [Cellvibrionaceae bacterium]